MATIIAIANRKGGVGKTTATIEIAANLSLMKKKILVIDFDPQGDATRSVDGDASFHNIYQAITVEDGIEVVDCIQKTAYFDLIASSKRLSKADKEFTDRDDVYLLEEVISIIKDKCDYDYILIDNNPELGQLFMMAMVAADYVIIPTLADDNSLEGVDQTEQVLGKLVNGRAKESHAQVLGYILSRKKRASLHTIAFDRLQDVAKHKDNNPFVSFVSDGVKMDEIKTFRKPISVMQRGSTQAREFYRIAEEIVKRLEA